jgi:hypothetical protein
LSGFRHERAARAQTRVLGNRAVATAGGGTMNDWHTDFTTNDFQHPDREG